MKKELPLATQHGPMNVLVLAEADGLFVHKPLDGKGKGYKISHIASGYSLSGRLFKRLKDAKAALQRAAPLADWKADKDVLLQGGNSELGRALRDIYMDYEWD